MYRSNMANFWRILLLAAFLALGNSLPQNGGVVFGDSSSSNTQSTNSNSQGTVDTRLGLVGNVFGKCPVPGVACNSANLQVQVNVNTHQNTQQGRENCWCQSNQRACGSNTNNGGGSFPIDVRIVNRPTNGQNGVCRQGERYCCPSSGSRPTPTPSIVNSGSCGRRSFIGGKPANNNNGHVLANFAEYPWLVAIVDKDNNYKGAGAIINNRWVLTAAHKVHQYRNGRTNLKARLGDYDVGAFRQGLETHKHEERQVSQIIVHERFNPTNLYNDVALLKLDRRVRFNRFPHISPVCLPSQGQLFYGSTCWVAGWGRDEFRLGQYQAVLREVDVPMVDPDICENRIRSVANFTNFILDKHSFTCAGGQQGKDACQGDGGAPLVCQTGHDTWTVVGLVAWGVKCGLPGIPGVYVNVPNFVHWINQYTGGSSNNQPPPVGDVRISN